jgi:hypothetical protein
MYFVLCLLTGRERERYYQCNEEEEYERKEGKESQLEVARFISIATVEHVA